MLTIKNLEKFTKQAQTDLENVVREYCQHLFLSYLYQQPNSERLLFNFRNKLRSFLPASHSMLLRDFKKLLEQKIRQFL